MDGWSLGRASQATQATTSIIVALNERIVCSLKLLALTERRQLTGCVLLKLRLVGNKQCHDEDDILRPILLSSKRRGSLTSVI